VSSPVAPAACSFKIATIAAAMCELMPPREVKSFSITFDDPSFDEGPYARLVAQHLGQHPHLVAVVVERGPVGIDFRRAAGERHGKQHPAAAARFGGLDHRLPRQGGIEEGHAAHRRPERFGDQPAERAARAAAGRKAAR
jgi:hypothetical protein